MLMTGFLSLNVHDSLTFDGAELCLHPDLFPSGGSTTGSANSGNHGGLSVGDMIEIRVWDPLPQSALVSSTSTSTASVTTGTGGANILSAPGTPVSVLNRSPPEARRNSSTGSSLTPAGNAAGVNQNFRSKTPPPPLPATPNLSNSNPSSPHRTASTATTPTAGVSAAGASSAHGNSAPVIPNESSVAIANVPSNIQTTDLRPRALSMANSLAYSVDSENPQSASQAVMDSTNASTHSQNSNANQSTDASYKAGGDDITTTKSMGEETNGSNSMSAQDAGGTTTPTNPLSKSPIPPAKTVTLPSASAASAAAVAASLPPVFPRGRLNSADNVPLIGTKPKALGVNRRGRTSSSTANTNIGSTTPNSSSRNLMYPAKTAPLHSRDISDVTLDTHQLDNMDLLQAAGIYNDGNTDNLIPPENPKISSFPRLHSSNTIGNYSNGSESRTLTSTHCLRLSFVLLVTHQTLSTLKGNTRTQISMLRQVADLYALSRYDTVTVHKIAKEDEEEALKAVSADYVLVSIKDQFMSRGDMLYFQNSLKGSWIYEGERLVDESKGIKAHAREIRHGNKQAKSGIVTDETMITFRSRSARIFWLVQLSSEMWEYASPYDHDASQAPICEIYFDKWTRFLKKLFTKWKEMEVTHSLTVIFFSRTLIYNGEKSTFNLTDVYGRQYEDHYKPVIENETCMDWHSLVVRIKEAFVKYPFEVGWSLDRRPTSASQGNVLEAINLTLNLMQFHYLDRDLHRTGQSLVVVSPGCGLFEVDKRLAEITYKRMMDHGIGSDMLSLGLPPLHIAPIFLYAVDPRISTEANGGHYEVPHWMHLSFISYDKDDDSDHEEEKKDSGPVGKNKPIGSWLESYEVATNGFLRPKVDIEGPIGGGDNERASTFSAIGNAAATPVKAKSKKKKERQLIEGRDFRDILDACRPKVRSMIPSPLLFILKQTMGQDLIPPQTKSTDEPNAIPLIEWGTANTNELIAQDRLLIQHLQSRKKKDAAQRGRADSDSASSASSKVDYSQILSTTPLSSSPKIFQLQRSNSIKLSQMASQVPRAPSPSMYNDGSTSASPSSASGSSLGRYSVEGKSPVEVKQEVIIENSLEQTIMDQNERIEHLRKLMEDHDAVVCSSFRSNYQSSRTRQRSPNTLRPSDSSISSRKQSSQRGGGIADALSQYERKSSSRSQTSISVSSNLNQSARKQERPRKSSPLLNPMNERGQRSISPIVLSPPDPDVAADEISRSFNKHISPRDGRLLASRSGFGSTHTLPVLDSSSFTGSPIQFLGSSMSERLGSRPQQSQLLSKTPPLNSGSLHGGTQGSKGGLSSSPARGPSRESSSKRRSRSASSSRGVGLQRQVSYNPFRQSDEDEVLATKDHNRRRWSHVFAEGEVEFKRHAGPIWNSLTSPAILPLSVDYLPSPQELRDETRFRFTPYSITLSGIEKSFYNTHDELMMEMVRMRVTQDYQIVTAKAVKESHNRTEQPRQGRGRISASKPRATYKRNAGPDTNELSKHYLSMGHIIQVLYYDPTNDTIEVVVYLETIDYKDYYNYYNYRYLVFSDVTKQYVKSTQTFMKYKEAYRWNKSDNIMCGEEEPELIPGMRGRRLMFGLVPPSFKDEESEKAYISKFTRLLDYLGRLREKESSKTDLGVEIRPSSDDEEPNLETLRAQKRSPRDQFVRFIARLQRSKRDPIEWLEISIESVFVPSRSYKIVFNWLVASSSKVEGQIQLLHRRCTQFGLQLVPIPHTTTFENLHQHSFSVPTIVGVRNKEAGDRLDALLKGKDFVYDGVQMTKPTHILEFLENSSEYEFERYRWGKQEYRLVASKQYVHRSGALCVRLIPDTQGLVIFAAIENQRNASRENNFREIARTIILELQNEVEEMEKVQPMAEKQPKQEEQKTIEEAEKVEPNAEDDPEDTHAEGTAKTEAEETNPKVVDDSTTVKPEEAKVEESSVDEQILGQENKTIVTEVPEKVEQSYEQSVTIAQEDDAVDDTAKPKKAKNEEVVEKVEPKSASEV